MLRFVLSALLVGYLPGALLFRVPIASRGARAALDADERVFWHVIVSVAWSVSVVFALASAGVYRFERLLVVNGVLALAILVLWRLRLRYASAEARRPAATALLPIALCALGAWLFFPPSEYVMGGKDPGTYMNEGIQIAQRGRLVIRDPVVADVPEAASVLFFPPYHNPDYYSSRFMGFFVLDRPAGAVVGQFPHFLPASIAIGYGLNGLSGARQTTPVWAILGLAAIYLVGARLVGRAGAAAASALLAINVVDVWFARQPNSEHVMQALLFAGTLAFVRATEGQTRFFGPLAGALIGLQMLLRYEIVLVIGALTAAWACLGVDRRRVGRGFWIVLAPLVGLGVAYLAGPLRAYGAYPLGVTRDYGGWTLAGAAIVAAMLFRWLASRDAIAPLLRRWLPRVLAIVLIILAAYAWFLRQPGGGTTDYDADSLRIFAWYVTRWGVWAGVLGLAVLIWRRFWTDPAFVLACTAIGGFFFYKTRISPEHFFSMRRFLTAALPAMLIGVAALAAMIADALFPSRDKTPPLALWRPVAAGALTIALLAPFGIAFWRAAAPLRPHIEQAGLIPQLETLAGAFTPDDFVIVESRNASDTHVLALPLAYIYDRSVAVLANPRPDKQRVELFLDWASRRFDRVFFLGGGGTDLLSRHIAATPVKSWQFSVPEYDTPMNAYPRGVTLKEFDFGLYQLTRTRDQGDAPMDLTLGTLDELNVVRFHSKERNAEGQTFRWTRDVSYVVLTSAGPSTSEVTIWMGNGGRPAAVPPADVEVALEDRVLGSVRVDNEIRPHRFTIPPDVAAAVAAASGIDPIRLRLRTTTWQPSALLGGSDGRDLGVIVTRVQTR